MLKKLLLVFFQNIKLFLLVLLGTLTWSLTMVKSGITYSYGMGFWGPNGHDGIWHIALAKSLARGAWDMPIFAGETIKNYHIGFDLVLAALHKLTFIPIHIIYFQILPPILAVLIGFYSYRFVLAWSKDKAKAYWATFFVYFGGSFGWVISFLKDRQLSGESAFWSQQSVSTLINPPFALSLVLIFAGLYYLIRGNVNKKKRDLILVTFLFGVLVQIKVYAGIILLVSLFIAGIWNIWKRQGLTLMKVFIGSLVISILLFTPTTKEVGQVILFKPLWFLETMMGFSDRVGWTRFGEAMINYKLGHIWIKTILSYGFALIIFIVGNFGTRLLTMFWFWKRRPMSDNYKYIDVFVITTIILGILIPLLYIQSGTNWNTIQFMYYSLVFAGVLAGISFVDIIRGLIMSRLKNRLAELILIVFTLPTSLGVLYYHYLPMRPPAMIPSAEMDALKYLSELPKGVVLTQPFNKYLAEEAINNPPRPLYLYESSAYVSAFSGKPTFLEDQVNLEITGYDWVARRNDVESYFTNPDSETNLKFLESNNIKYLYVVRKLQLGSREIVTGIDEIYKNDEVIIYRVN